MNFYIFIFVIMYCEVSCQSFGNSEDCQKNINDVFQNGTNATSNIINGSTFKFFINGSCTGTLVNRYINSSELGFYFITAKHCIKENEENQLFSFMFNYQSPTGVSDETELSNRGNNPTQTKLFDVSLGNDNSYEYYHESYVRKIEDYIWCDFALYELLTPITFNFSNNCCSNEIYVQNKAYINNETVVADNFIKAGSNDTNTLQIGNVNFSSSPTFSPEVIYYAPNIYLEAGFNSNAEFQAIPIETCVGFMPRRSIVNRLNTNIFTKNDNYNIYPNPSRSGDVVLSNFNFVSYDILSMDGKCIKCNIYEEFVNTTNLSSGLYLLNPDDINNIRYKFKLFIN